MKNENVRERDGMKKGIYILPNLFTTASLFFGFYAIIISIGGNFPKAALLVIVACAMDGLDGKIARFTHTTSRFGVEYDSLSDLVSFGVAPAVIAYLWALAPYGRAGWIIAFLFVVCGAMRLARFNVQLSIVDSKVFNGLPIPAAALVIVTAVLFWDFMGGTGTFHNLAIPVGTVALALLMVSSVKYYSFKDLNFFARKPFVTFVLIVLMFVVIVMQPQIMFFAIALSYALSGPSRLAYRVISKKKKELSEERNEFGG
ncbi:MAG: CDP-diacylglycerol--serine O-phosphatidyltransferase [Syntrophales bacterium]|jgi:CDP-diacylglycerol--serine O-phosphatidyltransferase|nr:CDP-diacylglycerol--serine O-phosphatidyltransferase [Syntrophales bacterium]MCK9528207.1 CDP-diacylglycerol--serine O-phosphatidyltransferase [Syntrophales bacterium]MDX9921355.1 CDP-diacylglycerol--serine O-phosphatidyltransferase [Syntrophales bacterium]